MNIIALCACVIIFIFILVIICCFCKESSLRSDSFQSSDLYANYPNVLRSLNKHAPNMNEFNVKRIIPCDRQCKRAFVYSLFISSDTVNGQEITEDFLNKTVNKHTSKHRMNMGSFWKKYVAPLIKNTNTVLQYPEWKIRLYLDPQLELLIQHINRDACEIYIMNEPHKEKSNPGAMYRFLALDDTSLEVCMTRDTDDQLFDDISYERLTKIIDQVPNTTSMISIKVPMLYRRLFSAGKMITFPSKVVEYTKKYGTIRQLMEQFIHLNPKGNRDCEKYPGFGFDEYFTSSVLFHILLPTTCVVMPKDKNIEKEKQRYWEKLVKCIIRY